MIADVQKIIARGETETTEFRGARTPVESLAKAICGMLNQQGGTIVVGVADDGDVVGLSNHDQRVQQLHDYVAGHLHPRPLFSATVHDISGKPILTIDVPQGADKPYSLNRAIYVRVGASTLRADAETSTQLVQTQAAQLDRWEQEPVPGFEMADCDDAELIEARREIVRVGRMGKEVAEDDAELLRQLRLMRGGQFTNAALVLFAKEPPAWAPGLGVRIVSYATGKSGQIANDVRLTGPAVRVLHQAVTTIQQRTGYSARFERDRLRRTDLPAYALFALREGLVNALVHRDYAIAGGQTLVEIYPDRLTIRNPGRLPDGWVPADLRKEHTSIPRNPDIARVFYVRELMEQLGMGTQKVIDECKRLGAKPPVWETEQLTVSLTLYRAPEPEGQVHLSQRQRAFLDTTQPGEAYRTSDYADTTGVVVRQAQRDLAELTEYGLFQKRGKGRAIVYLRTDKSP